MRLRSIRTLRLRSEDAERVFGHATDYIRHLRKHLRLDIFTIGAVPFKAGMHVNRCT